MDQYLIIPKAIRHLSSSLEVNKNEPNKYFTNIFVSSSNVHYFNECFDELNIE